jgi:hypothetical protein
MLFLLPWKIKCDLRRFDVTESKYGNQNAVLPITFKGETFKVKNYVSNIKDLHIYIFIYLNYSSLLPMYNSLPKT